MMNDFHEMDQERMVLRWGGLAGMLGCIFFILAWVVVLAGPVGVEDPTELAGWVTRFPDIKMARVVENIVTLVANILEIPLFLASYWSLRKTRLAPALFGTVLGIVGLTVMAVGATPHVAHATLYDLYRASGVTPADQAAVALMWQESWGIFFAILYVGFFVVPIGIILLGAAMFESPVFGKSIGVVSMLLGLIGLITAVLQMVDPASMIGAATYFTCLIFYLVMGWKLYSWSRTGWGTEKNRGMG